MVVKSGVGGAADTFGGITELVPSTAGGTNSPGSAPETHGESADSPNGTCLNSGSGGPKFGLEMASDAFDPLFTGTSNGLGYSVGISKG
jgi:hypothetical protein